MENDIREFIKETLKEIVNEQCNHHKYQSDSINELATALAKAQGEYPIFSSNRENPFFKSRYADLSYIFSIAFPILSKHGLSISQEEQESKDASVVLVTVLRHSSGQYISSRSRFTPQKADPQSFGSALNYRKRYAVCSLLGIAVSSDSVEDDAEEIMKDTRNEVGVIGENMAKYLEQEVEGFPDLKKTILEKTGISSLAYLPKAKYQSTIDWIRKNTRQQ